MNCVCHAHDLGPFAVLFSTIAAAPRIFPSTADKLLPGSRFDMRQVFATSPVVVFNLSRRGDDGDDGCYCQPAIQQWTNLTPRVKFNNDLIR